MCSRYSLTSPVEAVRATFRVASSDSFPPRYNIAPTQPVLIVRAGADASRELVLVRWGLLPPWVKAPREFATLINARAETATEKPSFRGAMRHRRCLVPTDGYYEWTGKPGAKRPHLIRRRGGGLFAMAGLWEHWVGADGSELETMAILTVAANEATTFIHDRMPAILLPEVYDTWLDCAPGTSLGLSGLLKPAPEDLLEIIEVDPRLNNSRNEGPDVQRPLANSA